MAKKYTPITTSSEWSYDHIEEYYNHIARIAEEKFHLIVYPNQLEIISSEQMLEAYSSRAMPVYYDHWSIGMQFIKELQAYRHGHMGLAYEVVINSKPCISYLMEENTMLMQILVTAHAAFGHNHFFKNNYLFREWTDAEYIIDYLVYTKKFIRKCEEKYGEAEVEEVLDACHALNFYGIDKYKKPPKLSPAQEEAKRKEREEWERTQVNVLWKTIPVTKETHEKDDDEHTFPPKSEENILKFIEENAPNLPSWKREIIRIIRTLSQYFYPQIQTKLMNEGFATFIHYSILTELHEEGLISDGYLFEFLHYHTSVVTQLDYDSPYYNGINVYALGFAIYKDIKRVSMEPNEEDKNWFFGKDWVGNGKWLENILFAVENFKDESFILEYLSPKIIKDFKLFSLLDDDQDDQLEISAIHNERGYKHVREVLSENYNFGYNIPEIQVAKGGVDLWGDRSLLLEHIMRNRIPLEEENATEVLKHARVLWGYNVKLKTIDIDKNIKAIYEVTKDKSVLDVFINETE